LDFVYLDAAHDYDNVKLDIKCWYPKVREGGILGGHDIIDEGVKKAVNEKFKLSYAHFGNEWFIVK